jgi:hypothetical protein
MYTLVSVKTIDQPNSFYYEHAWQSKAILS